MYGNLEIKRKQSVTQARRWSVCLVSLVTHTAIIGIVLPVSIDPAEKGGSSPFEPSCSPHTFGRKMTAGLLLLVCAGAFLYSAEAQDPYNGLPDNYKKGVDLAVEQLNTHAGVHLHFRFLRSLQKSDIEVNLEFMIL